MDARLDAGYSVHRTPRAGHRRSAAFLHSRWSGAAAARLLDCAAGADPGRRQPGCWGCGPPCLAPRRIALILISAALFLTLAVEIFVFDGDIGRMNMVFKFYVQVWLLLSVVAGRGGGLGLACVAAARPLRLSWHAALSRAVFIAALYPLLATRAKWDIRMSADAPLTLDGMAFMRYHQLRGHKNSTVKLDHDYEAIAMDVAQY